MKSGEPLTLAVHGEPVADIVPHARRTRWLSGSHLREQREAGAADPALRREFDELVCQTLDEA